MHERSSGNKEKAVDTELVVRGMEIIWSAPGAMGLIIVSGDRDFIPLVRAAHRRDWSVEMAAFASAFNAAGEMAASVEKVTPLDAIFARIGHRDFDWPI